MPEESGCADSLVFPTADPLALLLGLVWFWVFGVFLCGFFFYLCVWLLVFWVFVWGFFENEVTLKIKMPRKLPEPSSSSWDLQCFVDIK